MIIKSADINATPEITNTAIILVNNPPMYAIAHNKGFETILRKEKVWKIAMTSPARLGAKKIATMSLPNISTWKSQKVIAIVAIELNNEFTTQDEIGNFHRLIMMFCNAPTLTPTGKDKNIGIRILSRDSFSQTRGEMTNI